MLPTCAVQTLSLSTNSVGDEGAEALAQKISSECCLNSPPAASCPHYLQHRAPTVTQFRCSVNPAQVQLTFEDTLHLYLQHHTCNMWPFCPIVSGNAVLRTLDLSQNGIGDKGARALAEGLKLNTTLMHLDLSGNAIDKEGISKFVTAGIC